MTGPFVPVAMLNLIRALLGIHLHRFNLSVKRSKARELVAQIHKTLVRAENVESAEDEEQVLLECRESLSESYFCIATLVAKLQRARGTEITDITE
jgi:hypothetical protein